MIKPNSLVRFSAKTDVGEDEYGNTVWQEFSYEESCLIGWGSTGMDFGVERNIQTTQATLYFQDYLSFPVTSVTDIYINAEKYRIDGEPLKWQAPQGFSINPGLVIPIKKVEG